MSYRHNRTRPGEVAGLSQTVRRSKSQCKYPFESDRGALELYNLKSPRAVGVPLSFRFSMSSHSASPTSLPTDFRAEAVRHQQNAAKLSLVTNVVLVLLKVGAGVASGAISVLSEGVQSSLDVIASLMILYTIQRASRPPDPAHPYGHGKMENLTSLAQTLLIGGSAIYILREAWLRWQKPEMPELGTGAFVLGFAIACNFFVSRHLKKVSTETGSQALAAEATHLRGDMLSCAGVLLGLGAVWIFHKPELDPIIAAVMSLVVIVSAIRLGHDTVRPLLDEKLPTNEEEQIRGVLDANTQVLGYHRLRTRQAGSHRLMDVHVQLDDNLSFSAAHAITEDIEDEIRKVLPNLDVIVHAEPFEEELNHQREAH
jgi:cation diffusion facilitator family transporter